MLGAECIEVLTSLDDFEHFAALMERVASGRVAVLPINDLEVEGILDELEWNEETFGKIVI